jgi:hypothetical protein
MWPETVPILNARDIIKGDFDGPNNTHCLRGWVNVGFSRDQDLLGQ